ncbi:MAG TPA: hypothetical protein VF297_12890 [Pyrinomonadaceae bacterium]
MSTNPNGHRVLTFNKYELQGKKAAKEDAVKYPVLAAGEGLPNEDLVYAFDSKESFAKWAEKTKHAEKIAGILKGLEKVKGYEKKDNTVAKRQQAKLAQRVLEDLKELSDRTGLPIASTELLKRASDESEPLEGRIFHHSSVLWEHPGGWGAAWPAFGVPFPDLNWFQWGNRASSVSVNNFALLTDNPWYGGQSVYLFGVLWTLYNLANFGFERRTEAIWS